MAVATVELPDGRRAKIEVPSGTPPEQIQAQVAEMYSQGAFGQKQPSKQEYSRELFYRQLNDSLSGPERFAVGAGRGLQTVGRGLGLVEPEPNSVRQSADMLSGDSLLAAGGEIVGMAAPFLVPGLGPSAAKSMAGRVALGTALGAAEGNIIARGQGGDTADQIKGTGIGGAVAGGAEILFPVLGRLGRAVLSKLGRTPRGALIDSAGKPSQELLSALSDSGMTFDDLTSDAIDFIAKQRPGAKPDEVARLARFKSQGIPATMGDISQDFKQQAAESRLVSMAGGEAAEPLRQFRLQQSEAFSGKVDDLIRSLGVPDRAGESIKSALTGRELLLRNQKNALYREAAEKSKEVGNIPIFGDKIVESLPDRQTLRRLSRIEGGQVGALQNLLVEFGIDQSDEAVEAFAKSGGEVVPLTLGNLEDFRAGLNQILRADRTGAASVAAGPVLKALDSEADEIAKALSNAGVEVGEDVLNTLKAARSSVVNLKQEFSPLSLTGRLIEVKRDGITPIVEASRVFRELERQPVEQVTKTMQSLFKSGDEGRQAIGDIKASVVLNALDNALKAPSRKTSGIETIGGNQFAKYLDGVGEDRLKVIFKGDDKTLNALMGLKQTALDMTPTAGAVPRGSAPVILDLAKRFGRLPGVAAAVDAAMFVVSAGADDRAVRRALLAKPQMQQAINQIGQEFPALASALGVAAYVKGDDDE